MNDFDIIKSQVDLLDHVKKRLWQEGKKEGVNYKFFSWKENTASLTVYGDYKTKWYKDFSKRLWAGTVIDFEMSFMQCNRLEAMKSLAEMYRIELSKKEPRKKSPKQIEVFENFDTYRMQSPNDIFVRWMKTRGFEIDTIKAYKQNILKVSKELGTCEGLALWNSEFRDVIVFPCHDGSFQKIGAKLRRADGEKIGEIKSKTIKDTKTGLLYNPDDFGEEIYVCEGEADYIVLKSLGFFSLIGNLGGVGANADKIQKIVKQSGKIICLYDNDKAGFEWAKSLQEKIWRPIRVVPYPKIDGLDKYDINDLFKQGWREEEFQELFEKAEILSEKRELAAIEKNDIQNEEKKIDFIMNYKNPIIFLRKNRKFYDFLTHSYCSVQDLSFVLNVEPKEVGKMFLDGRIPKFYDICYRDGGKKWYFNIFNKDSLIIPSNTPKIHEDIKLFIENLGNGKEENYNWIHKAILYKYTHLNDEKVPALIIHSDQWVGKGTFLNFLKKIFWDENTQEKLTGRSIVSWFDSYLGNKMIVEIDELETKGMTEKEIYQLSNRIKSMVFAKTISVNPKNVSEYTTDNLAWFIITSNDIKPLNIEKSDRRYSIIEGWRPMDQIDPTLGSRLNDEIFENTENIQNYLAWLFQEFPEVLEQKRIFPLDNEDKRYIQKISQNPTEEFFNWFCEKFPKIWKISAREKKFFVEMYRNEVWETDNSYDYIYEKTFNRNLPRGIKYGNTSIRGKSPKGYTIENKKNNENWYFETDTYEEWGEKEQNLPF